MEEGGSLQTKAGQPMSSEVISKSLVTPIAFHLVEQKVCPLCCLCQRGDPFIQAGVDQFLREYTESGSCNGATGSRAAGRNFSLSRYSAQVKLGDNRGASETLARAYNKEQHALGSVLGSDMVDGSKGASIATAMKNEWPKKYEEDFETSGLLVRFDVNKDLVPITTSAVEYGETQDWKGFEYLYLGQDQYGGVRGGVDLTRAIAGLRACVVAREAVAEGGDDEVRAGRGKSKNQLAAIQARKREQI